MKLWTLLLFCCLSFYSFVSSKPIATIEWIEPQRSKEMYLGGTVRTEDDQGRNVLTGEHLLSHVTTMVKIANLSVETDHRNWKLGNFCEPLFRPPHVTVGAWTELVRALLARIVPCKITTPLDCFWEGSKPLGPYPPIQLTDEMSALLPSLTSNLISHRNLNPQVVLDSMLEFFPDFSNISTYFQEKGVDSGYQDRPCIAPLDPECPESAPNAVRTCSIVEAVLAWNERQPDEDKLPLVPEEEEDVDAVYKEYYSNYDDKAANDCRRYKTTVFQALTSRRDLIGQILPTGLQPEEFDFGVVLWKGCPSYASKLSYWETEEILGGVEYESPEKQMILRAGALQSSFYILNPEDVVFKSSTETDLGEINEAIDIWKAKLYEFLIPRKEIRGNLPEPDVDSVRDQNSAKSEIFSLELILISIFMTCTI